MQPPLAEPHGIPKSSDEFREFRVKFWPYFLTFFAINSLVVMVGGKILFALPVFARHPELFPPVMAKLAFLAFSLALAQWFFHLLLGSGQS